MSISAQESYPISKPVKLSCDTTLYCWPRPDVINIIHLREYAKQCKVDITDYQQTELLYKRTVEARDSSITVQDGIIATYKKIDALRTGQLKDKDEQLKIKDVIIADKTKKLRWVKIKAGISGTAVGIILTTIGLTIAHFKFHIL